MFRAVKSNSPFSAPRDDTARASGGSGGKSKLLPVYRCLYSRNISNLMMAGRNISVTHIALGTVRVRRTNGMMGEVLGMAATLCKQRATTPRGVYERHLEELKTLMRRGVGKEDLDAKDRR